MRKRIVALSLVLGALTATIPAAPVSAGHQNGGICFLLYKIFGGEPCGE